jgi:hypothetical protein
MVAFMVRLAVVVSVALTLRLPVGFKVPLAGPARND